jgi:uncharacterized protein
MFGGAYMIGVVFMLIGMLVGYILKNKFKKYSQIPSKSGLTGKEVAKRMLDSYGIKDVEIICVQGELTDHYDPVNKTVNLSQAVYNGANAAATAVSAHECGHAVQHATAYPMLKFRSALVPLQNVSGKIVNIVVMISIFGGAFLYKVFPLDIVLYVIIGAYAIMTAFSVITLPVEFDASNRALAWMEKNGTVVTQEERTDAKDALKWAATTYVVAALASLATLLYYISLLSNRKNN